MKLVILAGGLGTRISEESVLKPKPMIEIGGKPIIWHIMKYYSCFGINDFIICGGYKSYIIKEYFANYHLHQSNFKVNIQTGKLEIYEKGEENWNIEIIDTGSETMTGGRVKRIGQLLDETFCMTYGDGLSNVDINKLILHHKRSVCEATVTAVHPPGRFGALEIEGDSKIKTFTEKPIGDGNYINGGFFVLEKRVLSRIMNDETIWEREPLMSLAADNQLSAYIHKGFWQPMDTLREKILLENLYKSGKAPWKIWE
jgi:glucose-1-phosphate cytidylyltransferase